MKTLYLTCDTTILHSMAGSTSGEKRADGAVCGASSDDGGDGDDGFPDNSAMVLCAVC